VNLADHKVAIASTLGSMGGGGIMLVADHLDLPPVVLWTVGIFSLVCLLVSVPFWVGICIEGVRAYLRGKEKLPGFSAHLILQINDITATRRKYIFDSRAPDNPRVAFYQSASDQFIFEVKDTKGEPYQIEMPLGEKGIPFCRFFYLWLSLGVSATGTTLTAFVNNKEVARRELPFPLDMGSRDLTQLVIGADSNDKNHGKFDLAEYCTYSVTLNHKEAKGLWRYFRKRYAL
jgi:hypothetical protein